MRGLVLVLLILQSTRGSDGAKLVVTYGDNPVQKGELLTPDEAASEPKVGLNGQKKNTTYLLVMVDPDAPHPESPSAKWWRHWLVTDIPSSQEPPLQISSGTVVTEYSRPSPPPGSPHRYQIVLYEQGANSLKSVPPGSDGRGEWNLDEFVKENDLKEVAQLEFKSQNIEQ